MIYRNGKYRHFCINGNIVELHIFENVLFLLIFTCIILYIFSQYFGPLVLPLFLTVNLLHLFYLIFIFICQSDAAIKSLFFKASFPNSETAGTISPASDKSHCGSGVFLFRRLKLWSTTRDCWWNLIIKRHIQIFQSPELSLSFEELKVFHYPYMVFNTPKDKEKPSRPIYGDLLNWLKNII